MLELVGGVREGGMVAVEERAVWAAGSGEPVAAQGHVLHPVQRCEVADQQVVEDLDAGLAVAGAVQSGQQVVVRAEGAVGDGLGVVGHHCQAWRLDRAVRQLLHVEVGDVGVDADEHVVSRGAGPPDQGLDDALLPEQGPGTGRVEGDLDVADGQRLGVVDAVDGEAQGLDRVGDRGRRGGTGVDGDRAAELVQGRQVEVVQMLVAEDHGVWCGHAGDVHRAGRPDPELQVPGTEGRGEDRIQ